MATTQTSDVFHFATSVASVDTTVNITSGDEWEYIWDLFGRQMQPIASAVPYLVGVGITRRGTIHRLPAPLHHARGRQR